MVANTLPAKAARFVEEYLLDHNGAAAAVRAGYAPNSAKVTACRLLTRANVRALMAEKQGVLAKQYQLDRQGLIERLQRAAELAEAKQDPMGMVAAWREIGKLIGAYPTVKRKVEVAVVAKGSATKFETMTDVELAAIIAAGATPTADVVHTE